MTKKIFILAVLAFIAASVWGQSLQDNEFYRKMVELKAQSEAAFQEGDYLEARRLAEESQSYKEKSDQWIETQLAAYRARAALVRVKDRLAQASSWNAQVNFPDEYLEGTALYEEAYAQFHDSAEYVDSLVTSNRALEVLSVIEYVPAESLLPAYYKVRLIPGKRDCLWNIAEYEFIYDDPFLWTRLYEANKDILPQSTNPDLIHPGMILSIPELDGESRSGTWVDGEIQ